MSYMHEITNTIGPYVGADGGAMGVTSLTLANSTDRSVFVRRWVAAPLTGVPCTSATPSNAPIYSIDGFDLTPRQTLHLAFPSPWIVGEGQSIPSTRHACLTFEAVDQGGGTTVAPHVDVHAVGFFD